MISLHITVYETEDGDRFRVNAVDSDDPTTVKDMTDQYELLAAETEDGRVGFTVMRKAEAAQGAGS